jgi:hypothetical protein
MFKNREIRIRVAKTDDRKEIPIVEPAPWSPGNVAEAATQYTTAVAKTIVGSVAVVYVMKTASEIAINYAPKK